MPLLINVGLNRKASKDFQSVGVSLNMTAELDQGLLADPPRLQAEVGRIYSLAEDALEAQISGMSSSPAQRQVGAPGVIPAQLPASIPAAPAARSNGAHSNGSAPAASTNGSAYGGMIRPATESQMRALRAICKRGRLDLDRAAHEEFGIDSAEQLDVKQASALIDLLKERAQPAGEGNGRRWRP